MKGIETIYAQSPKELDATYRELQSQLFETTKNELARIGESNIERGRAIVSAFAALTCKDLKDGDKLAIEILRRAIDSFGDK